MNPSNPKARRTRSATLNTETLEKREMMTGGVGDTFAILPSTIKTANGHTTVAFALDPKLFTDTKKGNKSFVLGIDVAPASSGTTQPIVQSVTTPGGKTLAVKHVLFDPKVTRTGVQADNKMSSAALVTIPGLPTKEGSAMIYKVNIAATNKTSGAILVGFYLPGDAGGTGTVNQASINATQAALGTDANDTTGKYSFDADANRDGKIDKQDLAIAQQNMGIGTTVSPVISANLDPTGIADPTNRIASVPNVTVTGTATPGATITYSAVNMPTQTVTANASTGAYTVPLQLSVGSNTYSVVATDTFKQKITGSIAAITYTPGAQPVADTASLTAANSTTTTATDPATATTTTTTTDPATTTTTTTPTVAVATPTATATTTTTT